MNHWAVFLLLNALSVSADDTLYDHLKTFPSARVEGGSGSFAAQEPFLGGSRSDDGPSCPVNDIPKASVPPFGDRSDYLPKQILVNDKLSGRYEAVVEDSLYLQLVLLSSIGVLALMPENVTGWNKEELAANSLEARWKENVSTRPIWDKDDPFINYIGHPVSGAWYYTMARNDGMTITESAVFSALMSTFVWEYGYEAFAEVPSIQDLIVTPLAGSILGEGMYILERRLDANGGIVFGSKVIGSISYFFLDPLGRIAEGIKEVLGHAGIRPEVTMTVRTYPRANSIGPLRFAPEEETMRSVPDDYGFIITFQ